MSDVVVRDNPERGRYEALVDGDVAGFIAYELTHHVIDLVHTVVPDAYAGHGVGSALVRQTLDDVRRRNADGDWAEQYHRVKPTCPFVRSWIERHPDYQPLVERPRP